jgi:hypothetical protein
MEDWVDENCLEISILNSLNLTNFCKNNPKETLDQITKDIMFRIKNAKIPNKKEINLRYLIFEIVENMFLTISPPKNLKPNQAKNFIKTVSEDFSWTVLIEYYKLKFGMEILRQNTK